MRAFFGINMAMGITDMPEYEDYWSADPLLRNDYIASIMPRIRYEKLCQYTHCSVPQREDRADKQYTTCLCVCVGDGKINNLQGMYQH